MENLAGHAFISYVREDSAEVDRLQRILEAAGIPVWRDTANLWPGENWRDKIRDAITRDALVFIACFSSRSVARLKSYQYEELLLAVEQLKQYRPGEPWLIPVRFDDCDVLDLDLGAGRTLTSIQRADLFGAHRDQAASRLVAAVLRLLGRTSPAAPPSAAEDWPVVVERLIAQAEFQTAALRDEVADLEWLLQDRDSRLTLHSRRTGAIFNAQGPGAFAGVVQRALASSAFPFGLQGSFAAAYRPEARQLLIEYELPRPEAIPAVRAYRYERAVGLVQAEPRGAAEIGSLYEKLIARVALRTLAEAFDVTPAALVSEIVFNGYVSATDRAPAKPARPLLVSLRVLRESFADIALDDTGLDPVACLRDLLGAVLSARPHNLEAVRPVAQFDLSGLTFVEKRDAVSKVEGHPDLLELTPLEFEHLIRQLFEAMGMKSWVTQPSGDEGADVIAVNDDPVAGGLCIIQPKRYTKVVGVEAVHALAGIMADKHAAKGVLVTTSRVGTGSREFAARHGGIEIIEGSQLIDLLGEHLGLDAMINLPRRPS